MQHLSITQTAAEAMRTCARQVPTETGGVLVGTLAYPVVFAAGSPGPNSVKTSVSFSTDPAHDRGELAQARARVGSQLKYLGHWHKHPLHMTSPSNGDLRQARELVHELSRLGEEHPALLCIIVQDDPDLERAIFPYWLDGEQTIFRRLAWELVADDAPAARRALQAEPQSLAAAEVSHPWANPEFRFQFTPVGLARLKEEQAALERCGFTVTARSRTRDRRVFFELNRDAQPGSLGEHYLCIFPPEYPLGAPRLLSLPNGSDLPLPRSGFGWNSDMCVAELLASLTPSEAIYVETQPPLNPAPLEKPGNQPADFVPVEDLPHLGLEPISLPRKLSRAQIQRAAAFSMLGWLTAAILILHLRSYQRYAYEPRSFPHSSLQKEKQR